MLQWKENLGDFLLIQRTVMTILNDWTIIIPGDSCSTFALSDWPAIGIGIFLSRAEYAYYHTKKYASLTNSVTLLLRKNF